MQYVSFQSLGEIGNMCSQMQQFASLCAVASETGHEIRLPESSKSRGFGIRMFDLLDVEPQYEPDEFFQGFKRFRLNEKTRVDDRVFGLDSSYSYFVDGRFDLFTYWYPKHAQHVLGWNIRPQFVEKANEFIRRVKDSYETNVRVVAMHIRLGDYLLPEHHHFVRLWQTDYYTKAMQVITEKHEHVKFLIFSNDIKWCRENLLPDSSDEDFVDTKDDCLDFAIMASCDDIIIANSSFSLWAAFMNKNPDKTIVCPTQYLYEYSEFSHINGNYYPNDWTSINMEL